MAHILLVDDELSIRVTLSEFLRGENYEVKTAEDADQALNMLGAEDFDVVVTDIVMPRITGVKLLEAIKEISPDVQVILMTGEPTVSTASKAVRADAFDYLTKPISKEELVRTVSNAAKLKFSNDERLRLAEENQLYQKNLEQLVVERTKKLRESEERLNGFMESATDSFILWDAELNLIEINPAGLKLLAADKKDVLGKNMLDLLPNIKKSNRYDAYMKVLATGVPLSIDDTVTHLESGKDIYLTWKVFRMGDGLGMIASDITERREARRALKKYANQLETLNAVTMALSSSLALDDVLNIILYQVGKVIPFDSGAVFLREKDGVRVALSRGITPSVKGLIFPIENELFKEIRKTSKPLIVNNVKEDTRFQNWGKSENLASWMGVPLIARDTLIGFLTLDSLHPDTYLPEQADLAQTFAAQAAQVIENAHLYQTEQHRRLEAELLHDAARAVSSSLQIEEILRLILTQLKRALAYTTASVLILREDNTPELVIGSGYKDEAFTSRNASSLLGLSPILQQMARDLQPVVSANVRKLEGWIFVPGAEHVQSWLGIPLVVRGRMIGTLMVDSDQPDFFDEADVQIAQTLAQLTAQALEKARLFNQANQRLKRLSALHAIDKVISSSLDINLTLSVFLGQVLTQLEVDAASILIFDPFSKTLECIDRRGFRTSALLHTNLHIGQGLAGQAALQRKIKYVPNLQEEDEVFLLASKLSGEEFVSYYGVPLVAKGVLKGVLEIFHRSLLSTNDEWLMYLNALAGQAAIAIDNASMFTDLQHSNLELSMAYDSTLEGWAHALELRDMETEGHSRRVTKMTIRLAKAMGVGKEALVHMYRGALLHDIGKMGVPDNILLKPGPLTDEEQIIMRKHTTYARDMLLSIEYLRPALEIPYSHHERWDGSGYPDGLRGIEIPLAARIFAIVDVWDALNSDRPYRKAWPEEKVLAYIREQSGKHFDPKVTDAFFDMLD